MKRLKRIILNGLTVLSLLLFFGVLAMWVRSYTTVEEFKLTHYRIGENDILLRYYFAWYGRGGLSIAIESSVYPLTSGWPDVFGKHQTTEVEYHEMMGPPTYPLMDDSASLPHAFGFGWYSKDYPATSPTDSDGTQSVVTIPMYVFAIAAVLLPITRLFKWHRVQVRRRDHLCLACDYDLRPTSDRCPECGMAIKVQKVKA